MELNSAFTTELRTLLDRMESYARRLESITEDEYEAIRNLDAVRMLELSEQRTAAHHALAQLENEGRKLLVKHNYSEETPLSTVIDAQAGPNASEFQSLRRKLQERILKVDRQGQENRMRLHAAYNVSTAILNSLGLSQPQQGYSRGAAR